MHQFYGEVLSLKEKKSMERISSLLRKDSPKVALSQNRPNCPAAGVAVASPSAGGSMGGGGMQQGVGVAANLVVDQGELRLRGD